MRGTYLLSGILVLLALIAVNFGWEQWGEIGRVRMQSAALRAEIQRLKAEQTELQAVEEVLPAKFQAEALSDFFSAAIEAGEVLGAGVRIESRGNEVAGAPQFQDLKYGLKVAPTAVQAAAPITAAPALFSLLEEELHGLPVTVRKIETSAHGETWTLRMEVDVFGR